MKSLTSAFAFEQKYMFATVDIMLVTLFFTIQSIVRAIRKFEVVEIIAICIHWIALIQLPFWHEFLLYYAGGCYFLINFTLSHTHLPVTTEPVHWVEYSLVHTSNVKSGPFGFVDYWMGYLNYQIEHHMMPAMPQYKNWLARDKVKAFAKRHDLPYNLVSYSDAIVNTFGNLSNVSREVTKLKN